MKRILTILIAGTLLGSSAASVAKVAEDPARVTLTRLDCGTVQINDLNMFSDTDAYSGQTKTLSDGCYLIRHGNELMLWDTGLPAELKDKPLSSSGPMSATIRRTLIEQLADLGIRPEQITRVGISHAHFDHISQAAAFPNARLLIGARDWAALIAAKPDTWVAPAVPAFRPWLDNRNLADPVTGDRDIFSDGTVRMIDLPGHTPGHHGLLVKLKRRGYVLLTGDGAHFADDYARDEVPGMNTSRAETLASLQRVKELAGNLHATVVIQHEPGDVAKLPAFPRAAD